MNFNYIKYIVPIVYDVLNISFKYTNNLFLSTMIFDLAASLLPLFIYLTLYLLIIKISQLIRKQSIVIISKKEKIILVIFYLSWLYKQIILDLIEFFEYSYPLELKYKVHGIIFSIVVIIISSVYYKKELTAFLQSISLKLIYSIFKIAIASLVIIFSISIISSFYWENYSQYSNQAGKLGTENIIYIVLYSVLSAAQQEILYRKYIFIKIKEQHGFLTSLIFNSLLFSLLHFENLINTLLLIIISLIFIMSYYKSNTIILPIIIHAILLLKYHMY